MPSRQGQIPGREIVLNGNHETKMVAQLMDLRFSGQTARTVDNSCGQQLKIYNLNVNVPLRLSLSTLLLRGQQKLGQIAVCLKMFLLPAWDQEGLA